MATIKDNTGVKSEAATLRTYFGLPGQSVSEFMAEIKKLTPEAKTELAIGAAKELGWTVE